MRFLSSVAGLLDFLMVHAELRAANLDAFVRPEGLMGDPSGMAMFLGGFMFSSLYLVLRGENLSRLRRGFHLAAYGLAWIAIVASLSRANWGAVVVGHAVFLLLVNRRLLVAGAAALVVVATLAFPFLPQTIRERVQGTTEARSNVYRVGTTAIGLEGSAASRVVLGRVALTMFSESPLWGNGLEYFRFHTPKYASRYGVLTHKPPHNLYAKMGTEGGLIGLATLAWIGFAMALVGMRFWRSSSTERLWGAAILGGLAHLAVASLASDELLVRHATSACFWVMFGFSARACVIGLPRADRTPRFAMAEPEAEPAGAR